MVNIRLSNHKPWMTAEMKVSGASKDGEEDNTTAGVIVPEIKAVM